jgi:hypothetical protein
VTSPANAPARESAEVQEPAEALDSAGRPELHHEVGVGPWEGKLPEGAHWDPELLAAGDRRNVLDQYRYWTMDAIIAELDTRRHDFHIAIENW